MEQTARAQIHEAKCLMEGFLAGMYLSQMGGFPLQETIDSFESQVQKSRWLLSQYDTGIPVTPELLDETEAILDVTRQNCAKAIWNGRQVLLRDATAQERIRKSRPRVRRAGPVRRGQHLRESDSDKEPVSNI
jgi:hypothetical protein